METLRLKWDDNMAFTSEIDGHTVYFDAAPEHGGQGKGSRPKPLLLASLAGCSAMDVVSIANKMKIKLDDFNIDIEAELTEEHPKIYKKIHLIYEFWGDDLPFDKLDKAVQLSREKYCGVNAMLSKASDITYEIRLHRKNS